MNAYQEIQTSGNNWIPSARDVQYRSLRESPASLTLQPQVTIFDGLEKQMQAFASERQTVLQEIRKNFVLPADCSVTRFLDEHRSIPQVLLESAAHLRECFGDNTVFKLGTTEDDIGSRAIHAIAIWPGTVRDARAALAKFDSWWLSQPRSGAEYLTFSYELV